MLQASGDDFEGPQELDFWVDHRINECGRGRIMNNEQKNAFLNEVQAEYHDSENQKKRQKEDEDKRKMCQLEKGKGGIANVSDPEGPRRCFTC